MYKNKEKKKNNKAAFNFHNELLWFIKKYVSSCLDGIQTYTKQVQSIFCMFIKFSQLKYCLTLETKLIIQKISEKCALTQVTCFAF